MTITKTVTVRVPATSANCGSGFDVLGLACTLYNEFELTLWSEKKLEFEMVGEGADILPKDETSLFWQTVRYCLKQAHRENEFLGGRVRMKNGVPLSSGLGSSAATIVGALYCTNLLLDEMFSRKDLLQMATDLEGHPDNVAPALYGGFTISIMKDNHPETFAFMPVLPLQLIVCLPNFYLPTKAAREALPKQIPMKDAVFNVGRASLLIASLLTAHERFLRMAFDDKLHQPYREKLIPHRQDVFDAAKQADALGVCVSGAGPSLIAFTFDGMDKAKEIGHAMKAAFTKNAMESRIFLLNLDLQGAYPVEEEKTF